jgi:hypothetical protein
MKSKNSHKLKLKLARKNNYIWKTKYDWQGKSLGEYKSFFQTGHFLTNWWKSKHD